MNKNNPLVAFINSIINLDEVSEIRRLAACALLEVMENIPVRITNINGFSYDLPQTVHADLQRQWNNNEKIPAIKDLRAITGWGLIETKKALEDPDNFHQNGGNVE